MRVRACDGLADRLLRIAKSRLAPGGFVKTRIQSLYYLATPAIALGMIFWGGSLHAQTTPSSPTDQQAQPAPTPTPDTPPTQQAPTPAPTPDAAQSPDSAQAPDSKTGTPTATPSATDTQIFAGTVEKSGDKYMLKTDDGKSYDIDHQEDVKKYEGKRVRVQGKLDDTGTKIQLK